MSKEFLFKILLCGDGAVGKTSIREKYMGKGFSGSYMKTIGADFASHKTEIENNSITFQIFDLAGQDSYTVARKSFYKGGQAAFLIFDLQDPETMTNLGKTWIKDCIDNSEGTIGTFIVLGNKADLAETRQVSNEAAMEYCQRMATETGYTFVFLETSAMSGLNIQLSFEIMAKRLLRKHNLDIPLNLPQGKDLIKPASMSSNAMSSPPKSKNPDVNGILLKLDDIDQRLTALEQRFTKLTQIVRALAEK